MIEAHNLVPFLKFNTIWIKKKPDSNITFNYVKTKCTHLLIVEQDK